jgi:hypothetical protein
MPACPKCGGSGSVMARVRTGCGIASVPCECASSETPGKVPHEQRINYPPEVIAALQNAGAAVKHADFLKGNSDPGRQLT